MPVENPTADTLTDASSLVAYCTRQPRTAAEITDHFGWSHNWFRHILYVARNFVCLPNGQAIPRPVADDGYLYRVTELWADADTPAIYNGVKAALEDERTRAVTIATYIETAATHHDGRTALGRLLKNWAAMERGNVATLDVLIGNIRP